MEVNVGQGMGPWGWVTRVTLVVWGPGALGTGSGQWVGILFWAYWGQKMGGGWMVRDGLING